MTRTVTVVSERWPLHTPFAISRGTKTAAEVVSVEIADADGNLGRGEGVPYARYGETVPGVVAAIEAVIDDLVGGAGREMVAARLTGAAANAVDCALWDLEAQQAGKSVASLLKRTLPDSVETAVTLSLDAPDKMAAAAKSAKGALLKMKLGERDPVESVAAVHQARPDARLILDANEGWTLDQYRAIVPHLSALGVAMIEQPLPAADDAGLAGEERPVPLCADESVHKAADIPALADRYDLVNVKLDKAGGLTGALAAAEAAETVGLGLMVGCMVGTSLAMAPGLMFADRAAFIDLDGPLWLARDRDPALSFEDGRIRLPREGSWRQ